MSRMRRIAWMGAVGLLLGLGCGSEAGPGVGSQCESGDDCERRAGAACIIPWPDGYCTEIACTVGSCPGGARCVRGIEFANVDFDAFCLETCQGEGDCRDGYRCVDVSLPESVCAPGNT